MEGKNFTDEALFIIDEALLILELAGLTGSKLVTAWDNVFKNVYGFSALEAADIRLNPDCELVALSPAEIARAIGLKCGKFNKRIANNILEALGYQKRIGKNYVPTELGKPYVQMTDGCTYKNFKWFSGILDVLPKVN